VAADGTQIAISVATPSSIAEMHGFVPLHMFSSSMQVELAPHLLRFARTTCRGCSAFEYRMLATGAMSFRANAGLAHAAGILIHQEAGGYGASLTGERYSPGMTDGHLLLAPDATTWQAIRDAWI
jgi:fructose-1,6-bisphosphatase/inositol monophosphatase family enzyme